MKTFDRMILILLALVLSLVSFFVILVAFGWTTPLQYLNFVLTDVNNRWIIGIVGFILFVFGANVAIAGLVFRPVGFTKVDRNDFGEINITITAVENLIKKAAFLTKGIKDVQPLIKSTPQGIAVFLRVVIMPGTVVPATSREVQSTVKEYLEQTVGIDVVEVKVLITNVSQEGKSRIE